MKHQALFSSKDKSKKKISVICCKFLFGTLGVNNEISQTITIQFSLPSDKTILIGSFLDSSNLVHDTK